MNEFNKVAVTPLEEWIQYLKNGVIRPDTKAPGLEEARRKLIYFNMDKAEQLAYDEHINAVISDRFVCRRNSQLDKIIVDDQTKGDCACLNSI